MLNSGYQIEIEKPNVIARLLNHRNRSRGVSDSYVRSTEGIFMARIARSSRGCSDAEQLTIPSQSLNQQ